MRNIWAELFIIIFAVTVLFLYAKKAKAEIEPIIVYNYGYNQPMGDGELMFIDIPDNTINLAIMDDMQDQIDDLEATQ